MEDLDELDERQSVADDALLPISPHLIGQMELDDLIPDSQQFGEQGGAADIIAQSTTLVNQAIDDLMPDSVHLGAANGGGIAEEAHVGHGQGEDEDSEESEEEVEEVERRETLHEHHRAPTQETNGFKVGAPNLAIPIDVDEVGLPSPAAQPVTPTSQRAYISSRPRDSLGAQGFAPPDPNEDQEDWQLLRSLPAKQVTEIVIKSSPPSPPLLRPSSSALPHSTWIPTATLPNRQPSAGPSRHRIRTQFTTPPRSQVNDHGPQTNGYAIYSDRAASRLREISTDPHDAYMVDESGEPLGPDPTYTIPTNHVPQRSRLHGQIDGQLTNYSRKCGRRKWTKAEEILLYRTVQKVPLSVEYPLRVAWYLHGEHGVLSHDLEMFNPQHMKDKMRVIVTTRVNNARPIVGRARFWLSSMREGKAEFLEELKTYREGERERVLADALKEDEIDSESNGDYVEGADNGEKGETGEEENVDGEEQQNGITNDQDELEGDLDELNSDVEGEDELEVSCHAFSATHSRGLILHR